VDTGQTIRAAVDEDVTAQRVVGNGPSFVAAVAASFDEDFVRMRVGEALQIRSEESLAYLVRYFERRSLSASERGRLRNLSVDRSRECKYGFRDRLIRCRLLLRVPS